MTPDLDKKLCEKYPKIFKHRHGTVQETCMAWGFSHGDGWFNIIDTLCSVIQHHTDWKRKREPFAGMTDEEFEEIHQPTASQVKEKFGGLRFYCGNADDYVQGAITFAESMSYRTCEDCGAQGSKRPGGWVRTLCDSCDRRSKDPNVSC
jgi:hypothetical protein